MAACQLASCAPPLLCLAASQALSGVPVFVYHGIGEAGRALAPAGERKYWVAGREFLLHLRLMAEAGYESVLLGRLETGRRCVALTFDDGHASDYEITLPMLQAAGMRATFFVNTATVGTERRLTWAQLREMAACGMAIQSHAHEHVRLTRLAAGELRNQLGRSKHLLEDRLGAAVEFMSAPFGDVNRRVRDATAAAGYRALCTGRSWPAQPGRRVIPRIAVYYGTSGEEFRMLLASEPEPYIRRAARAALLYVPKLALSYLSTLRPCTHT